MSAGWLLLAPTSWAIITARKSTLKKDKRILLTQLHAATVFLGVVCATLGGVAIYLNKVRVHVLLCFDEKKWSIRSAPSIWLK